jgi:hypothetical protein
MSSEPVFAGLAACRAFVQKWLSKTVCAGADRSASACTSFTGEIWLASIGAESAINFLVVGNE